MKQVLRFLVYGWIGLIALQSCQQGENPSINGGQTMPKVVDYNFHIRPILSDKCFACHGPDAQKREAGLRLDTKEGAFSALQDYDNQYAFVPGKPDQSVAYVKITTSDTTAVMPPPSSNLKLNDFEIRMIKKWIQQGAVYKPHWSFVPPLKTEIPDVKSKDWPSNEIDYFIVKKLEEQKLDPNSEADKERLLKRLSFDLTGLPPENALMEEFINATSENAYEKAVDILLESPHFGEKMAIHWLDVARYADSHGYQDDGLRTMWPWRDWVIHAFNEDYTFDKFLTWQLAGDLLPDSNDESLLATGFNRNHKITQEGGVIDEEYRIEYVTDRTNTFGKAFLGLTFECAKCHDHKYDPISQKDYFSAFAFFDKVPEKGMNGDIFRASKADPPFMTISEEMIDSVLHFINKKDTNDVKVMVMQDSIGIRDTHILNRGNYDAKGEVVDMNMPAAILNFDTTKYASNRLGLSMWLLSEENPLTSRVFVNRIWQQFFQKGLVKTSGDFGMQGDLPTHPELLDWLASDFRENGWQIKRLIKQIVMSSTYRQSSVTSSEKLAKDPENRYLSRMIRARLTAEEVRDLVLASSGLLNKEIGGKSVKPYQPDGLWHIASPGRGELKKYFQDHGKDLYRRGLYTFIKRTIPPPVMLTFDATSRDQCEVRRLNTSTPLQALVMMNDPTILESARVLAEQLNVENLNNEAKVSAAFKRIVCRKIKTEELNILMKYYQDQLMKFEGDPELAAELLEVGEYPKQNERNDATTAALMQIIHTIYNMEESLMKS